MAPLAKTLAHLNTCAPTHLRRTTNSFNCTAPDSSNSEFAELADSTCMHVPHQPLTFDRAQRETMRTAMGGANITKRTWRRRYVANMGSGSVSERRRVAAQGKRCWHLRNAWLCRHQACVAARHLHMFDQRLRSAGLSCAALISAWTTPFVAAVAAARPACLHVPCFLVPVADYQAVKQLDCFRQNGCDSDRCVTLLWGTGSL